MKRLFRILGLVVGVLLLFVVASRMLTTDRADFPSDPGPINPLPECPASPNCVRVTRMIDRPPSVVFAEARAALEAIGAASIAADEASMRLDAVFNAFVFKDDMAVVVMASGEGSALHLRSASRTGHSDFGVNARRVRRFLDKF